MIIMEKAKLDVGQNMPDDLLTSVSFFHQRDPKVGCQGVAWCQGCDGLDRHHIVFDKSI